MYDTYKNMITKVKVQRNQNTEQANWNTGIKQKRDII